jgi:putative transposase
MMAQSIRTYRYRLYPTSEQQVRLTELLTLARWLYNHALAFRRKRWQESRYSVSYNEQAAMWKRWRNEQPDDNPLRLMNMTAGQQVLRRLDSAYRQFLSGKRGKPRFKAARSFNSLSFKPGDGIALKEGKLYVQSVGLMPVKWHRQLPAGTLKNIVVIRKPSGWYVLLQLEITQPEPKPSENPPVGIDVGIYHALALSDDTTIDSPQYLKAALQKLRVLYRTVSRRIKGSQRRRKAVHQLARLLEHIASQRRDWWHKIVHWLVSQYGIIVLEDLNLRFMLRNGNLARAAHDVALGLFYEILDYKAFDAGVEIIAVNPRNTSQQCSRCGVKVEKTLSVRVHLCPECGFTADRDVNAALNILSVGGVATVRR